MGRLLVDTLIVQEIGGKERIKVIGVLHPPPPDIRKLCELTDKLAGVFDYRRLPRDGLLQFIPWLIDEKRCRDAVFMNIITGREATHLFLSHLYDELKEKNYDDHGNWNDKAEALVEEFERALLPPGSFVCGPALTYNPDGSALDIEIASIEYLEWPKQSLMLVGEDAAIIRVGAMILMNKMDN